MYTRLQSVTSQLAQPLCTKLKAHWAALPVGAPSHPGTSWACPTLLKKPNQLLPPATASPYCTVTALNYISAHVLGKPKCKFRKS